MAVNPIVIIGGIALVGVVASMMGDDEAEAEEDLESLDFPIDELTIPTVPDVPVPGPDPLEKPVEVLPQTGEKDLESLDFPIDPVPGPGPGLAARLSASSIDIGVS